MLKLPLAGVEVVLSSDALEVTSILLILPGYYVKLSFSKHNLLTLTHFLVYLDLKKQVLDNLLPSNEVSSEGFHVGGKWFYLEANHCTNDHNGVPCDNFGLYLVRDQEDPCSWSVSYEVSARSKPTEDFWRCREKRSHTFTTPGESYGYHNLFKVPWSQIIAENSIYFINEVLYLKVEITMKA